MALSADENHAKTASFYAPKGGMYLSSEKTATRNKIKTRQKQQDKRKKPVELFICSTGLGWNL